MEVDNLICYLFPSAICTSSLYVILCIAPLFLIWMASGRLEQSRETLSDLGRAQCHHFDGQFTHGSNMDPVLIVIALAGLGFCVPERPATGDLSPRSHVHAQAFA